MESKEAEKGLNKKIVGVGRCHCSKFAARIKGKKDSTKNVVGDFEATVISKLMYGVAFAARECLHISGNPNTKS